MLPVSGEYALRVRWSGEVFDLIGDADREYYGLAWSAVAVPASVALAGLGGAALVWLARKKKTRRKVGSPCAGLLKSIW